MKIALVHDWLDTLGGADRVLIELHTIFPYAPIYTLFAREEFVRQHLPDAIIITSWLQHAPRSRSLFWSWAMTSAIESFDFSQFDLIISSSPFVAKGIIVKPRTKHICYCYSPTRELWDRTHQSRSGSIAAIGKHLLRVWDRVAADRVDQFIAISTHAQERIKKYYHRESEIIYPPVTMRTHSTNTRGDFFLIVSRLYPHKNIAIAIEAFNKLGYPLMIVGQGPQARVLKKIAGPTIHFLGFQPDERIAELYAQARAFIAPQEEDFGLTIVESLAHGTPVIALRKGGALEILEEGKTGEFFDDPIPEALSDAVRRFVEHEQRYNPVTLSAAASRFSPEHFRDQILALTHEPTWTPGVDRRRVSTSYIL